VSEMMTVASVARALAVSKKRVYQLIATGRLESLRPSLRTIRIPRSSVERFVQERLEEQRRELGLDLPPAKAKRAQ